MEPACDRDRVFVTPEAEPFRLVDAGSGRELWRGRFAADAAPRMTDEHAVVPTCSSLVCHRLESGQVVWQVATRERSLTPVIDTTGIYVVTRSGIAARYVG